MRSRIPSKRAYLVPVAEVAARVQIGSHGSTLEPVEAHEAN